MSRKNIIIVVSVATAAILAGVAYWYFYKKAPSLAPDTVLFPGGSNNTATTNNGGAPTESPASTFVPGGSAPLPRLYELHRTPVAGVGFFESGKSPAIAISARYLERGLGNIFETPLSTFVESRISNETRPRIVEAYWGNKGKSVVIRFLDAGDPNLIKSRIVNLAAALPTKIGTSTTDGGQGFVKTEEIFMTDNIPVVAVAEDGSDKLFYVERRAAATGITSNFKNLSVSSIFSSPFGEWLPQFPNTKIVTLTTKPSAQVPGHLFFVNPSTKTVTKILSGINGLTTLTNPDGTLVLYAETRESALETSVYNVAKKETRQIPVQTLPEKCAWSPKIKTVVYCAVPQSLSPGIYPDQWYQGVLSFSDSLWEIDAKTQAARQIMAPREFGAPELDMTNLVVSSDGAYLLFMNKVSGTPWVYKLSETTGTPSTSATSLAPAAITPDMQQIR